MILCITLLPSDERVMDISMLALPMNVTVTLCRQTLSSPFSPRRA